MSILTGTAEILQNRKILKSRVGSGFRWRYDVIRGQGFAERNGIFPSTKFGILRTLSFCVRDGIKSSPIPPKFCTGTKLWGYSVDWPQIINSIPHSLELWQDQRTRQGAADIRSEREPWLPFLHGWPLSRRCHCGGQWGGCQVCTCGECGGGDTERSKDWREVCTCICMYIMTVKMLDYAIHNSGRSN